MKKNNQINSEEMKVLIKNVYQLSEKLSGNISIKNLDNAAEFAVNLFGYSSWKEFKQNLKKENNLNNIENTDNDNSEKILSNYLKENNKDVFISLDKKYKFKERIEKKIEKNKSENYTSEFLVGSYLTTQMKTKQPRGLMPTDCIVTTNFNNNYKEFCKSHISWLIDNKQDFIVFSGKYIDDMVFPNSVYIIEKNGLRLNPIKEIINKDIFEKFFKIDHSTKSFSYLWHFLVKKCHIEGKDLNIDDLLNMTSLENLIKIKKEFEKDYVINKMLSGYLLNYIEDFKGEENRVSISQESKYRHYKENMYLINKLSEIKELYDNGYFTNKNEFSFKEAIFQKKKCIVKDLDNKLYKELILCEYIEANKEFKTDKNIIEKEHLIWILFLEAENWIKTYQTNDLNYHVSFAQYYYITSGLHKIEILLKEIKQILFLRQSMNYKNTIWKDKMLEVTKEDNTRFWYNSNMILKELTEKEAILWRTTDDPFAINGLEDFILEKIDLY